MSADTQSTDTNFEHSTPQIHFSTLLHYAVLELQSLHSAIHTCCFTIHNSLIRRDTAVHLLLSAGLMCCYSFFSNLLCPSRMRRFWHTSSL